MLPKVQPKFENFVKHGYRVSDAKVVYSFKMLSATYYILICRFMCVTVSETVLCDDGIVGSKQNASRG